RGYLTLRDYLGRCGRFSAAGAIVMPKISLASIGKIAVTSALVIAAVIAGDRLWSRYQLDPWTRDGRVRADVVQVAPDVAGLVTSVAGGHDQTAKNGDGLFLVDQAPHTPALPQAQAAGPPTPR